MLDSLGIGIGSEVDIEIVANTDEIRIRPTAVERPVRGRYRIEDLVARMGWPSSMPRSIRIAHNSQLVPLGPQRRFRSRACLSVGRGGVVLVGDLRQRGIGFVAVLVGGALTVLRARELGRARRSGRRGRVQLRETTAGVVELGVNLAQRTLNAVKGDDAAKLNAIADRLLCRPIKAQEQDILQASLQDLRAHYKASAADAEALLKVGDSKADDKLPKPELAAWTMVCNQLMNLDEVLNK
jgi:hypothetical protein